MRLAPVQHRAYTYTVTAPPAKLAVSLPTVKNHLKITGTNQDDLLTAYITAAIDYAEKFTRRDFITRTYKTFRDFFPGFSEGYYQNVFSILPSDVGNIGFEIRKSPLQTIDLIQYFVAGVLTTVDATTYYNTLEGDYSEVLTVASAAWPTNADIRLQAVQVTFKTGFGDSDTDMPPWVTEGVIQHVADMYANRGDCGEFGDKNGLLLPRVSKMLYLQNRIENL